MRDIKLATQYFEKAAAQNYLPALGMVQAARDWSGQAAKTVNIK